MQHTYHLFDIDTKDYIGSLELPNLQGQKLSEVSREVTKLTIKSKAPQIILDPNEAEVSVKQVLDITWEHDVNSNILFLITYYYEDERAFHHEEQFEFLAIPNYQL